MKLIMDKEKRGYEKMKRKEFMKNLGAYFFIILLVAAGFAMGHRAKELRYQRFQVENEPLTHEIAYAQKIKGDRDTLLLRNSKGLSLAMDITNTSYDIEHGGVYIVGIDENDEVKYLLRDSNDASPMEEEYFNDIDLIKHQLNVINSGKY